MDDDCEFSVSNKTIGSQMGLRPIEESIEGYSESNRAENLQIIGQTANYDFLMTPEYIERD
jgi:hypothetical protein